MIIYILYAFGTLSETDLQYVWLLRINTKKETSWLNCTNNMEQSQSRSGKEAHEDDTHWIETCGEDVDNTMYVQSCA